MRASRFTGTSPRDRISSKPETTPRAGATPRKAMFTGSDISTLDTQILAVNPLLEALVSVMSLNFSLVNVLSLFNIL